MKFNERDASTAAELEFSMQEEKARRQRAAELFGSVAWVDGEDDEDEDAEE